MQKPMVIFFGMAVAFQTVTAQWSGDTRVNTPVFIGPNGQFLPSAVPDGDDGAFVHWFSQVTPSVVGLYAQRLDRMGRRVFPASGVQLFQGAVTGAVFKSATDDGLGGAIVTWSLTRTGTSTNSDIFAQRIRADGSLAWSSTVVVCDTTSIQRNSRLISDGMGGAIITWEDYRSGSGDIFAQRVDSSGTLL